MIRLTWGLHNHLWFGHNVSKRSADPSREYRRAKHGYKYYCKLTSVCLTRVLRQEASVGRPAGPLGVAPRRELADIHV